MNLFYCFFLVLLSSLEAKEFCKIENILQNSEINCLKGQLLVHLTFTHKKVNINMNIIVN